eukprot:TRINITY_DN778328_c0_g1_i1.p1 TRINITY_DN778328_c0_g1~~TRINITY_DN778328_c0_g1_i1.p1  ORF type:complete len:100 (+),score=36.06 TRINITY_DN778328_c0_g1_i1:366-665(+)
MTSHSPVDTPPLSSRYENQFGKFPTEIQDKDKWGCPENHSDSEGDSTEEELEILGATLDEVEIGLALDVDRLHTLEDSFDIDDEDETRKEELAAVGLTG